MLQGAKRAPQTVAPTIHRGGGNKQPLGPSSPSYMPCLSIVRGQRSPIAAPKGYQPPAALLVNHCTWWSDRTPSWSYRYVCTEKCKWSNQNTSLVHDSVSFKRKVFKNIAFVIPIRWAKVRCTSDANMRP
jgi:hypothetical protein